MITRRMAEGEGGRKEKEKKFRKLKKIRWREI